MIPATCRRLAGRSGFFLTLLIASSATLSARQRAIFDFDQGTVHPPDISGNGTVATVMGASYIPAGYEGGAFEFDGIDDWIQVEFDGNPWTRACPQLTMGAFVRVDSVGVGVQSILSGDNGNFDRTIAIDPRGNGTPSWSAYGGWCTGTFAGPPATASSSWILVAVVYDRFAVHDLAANQFQSARLYVDGTEVRFWACPGTSEDFFAIGKNPGFGEFFHGAIDNAFFFSGALSKEQLDEIRVGGKAALLAVQPDNSEKERFRHDGFDREPTPEEVIVSTGAQDLPPFEWAYRTSTPGHAWAAPGFNDASWARGEGGFGYLGDQWEDDSTRTLWSTPDLYVRGKCQLSASDLVSENGAPLALWGRWDDRIEIFVNGVPAMLVDPEPPGAPREHGVRSTEGRIGHPPYAESLVTPWLYRYVPLTQEAIDSLRVGENTLAIHVANLFGAGYLDMGVVRNPFDGLPATGFDTYPGTARFLEAARRFTASHHVPTLSFAVYKDGQVVANYTLGHLDKEQRRRAPRDTFFRTASLNKAVTAACVRKLIEDGFVDPITGTTLTLETPFWLLLLGRGMMPELGVNPDPRVLDITVRHLLEHRSGTGYSPSPERLYEAFGPDARAWEMVRILYGTPLLFDPGSDSKYSNEGYFLLNYLVRLLTGDTEAFIESQVVQAAAGRVDPMILTTEQLSTRDPSEAWYKTREWPYDRWLYIDDSGCLSVTAQGYLRFMLRRLLDGRPASTPGHWWYFGGGEFSGATSNAYQEVHDGQVTAFVLLTNQHDSHLGPLWDEFVGILQELPDSKHIRPR